MPKIKAISKSRIHLKASSLDSTQEKPQESSDFPKSYPASSPSTFSAPQNLNFKNPFGEVVIDHKVLNSQISHFESKQEAGKDEVKKVEKEEVKKTTSHLGRPLNKKQRREEKHKSLLKKLEKQLEEQRKPKKDKVRLNQFKNMRDALSDMFKKDSFSDIFKKVDTASNVMDVSEPGNQTVLSKPKGKKTTKSQHMIKQNNLRNVPKFLRKKKNQQNLIDIMKFKKAIQKNVKNT